MRSRVNRKLAEMRAQAIVVVRFSYVAEDGFRLSKQGLDKVRATLYDPARLERRFRIFEALALPSLLAQTDPDFTLILLVGDDFPPTYKARLQQILMPLRDAHLIAMPPMHTHRATRMAIQDCRKDWATHLMTIRLDDDDALGKDCIEAHKRLAPVMSAVGPSWEPAVVCFNNGLFLELSESGNSIWGVVEKMPISVGTCMIHQAHRKYKTVFSADHRFLHAHYNCYTEALTPRFLRTRHKDNDSGATYTGYRTDFTGEELDALLAKYFPFTRDQLLAIPA